MGTGQARRERREGRKKGRIANHLPSVLSEGARDGLCCWEGGRADNFSKEMMPLESPVSLCDAHWAPQYSGNGVGEGS